MIHRRDRELELRIVEIPFDALFPTLHLKYTSKEILIGIRKMLIMGLR